MSFEKFGMISFTSESKAADFITYLEQGKVMTTRCKQCGTTYFPPKMDCPKCLDSEVEWIEVKGPGKLATYAVVNYGPTGFEDDTPYVLAVGDFEGGLRVFGRLSKDIAQDDIKVGMSLEIAPVKLGEDKIAYEFRAA
jgi:uncharacterized OB-fold protein